MSSCAKCGRDNQGHYKFCLGCGGELQLGPPSAVRRSSAAHGELAVAKTAPPPEPSPASPKASVAAGPERVCAKCGTAVPVDFSFCGQCGSRVDAAATAQKTMYLADAPAKASSKRSGQLVLLRPDGTEGGTHSIREGDNPIGRGAGPLFEADGYLSPQHAQIVLGPEGMVVRDQDSLNGTFVKLSGEEEVFDGDVFRIGQELLRFDQIHDPAPLPDGTEVMGSPNPGYWGRLVLIVGRDQEGSAFPLFGDGVALGRERGDILFPEDGYVSGAHARISAKDGRFYLTDLGSSNGTFRRIRAERSLLPGSALLMGQQLFRVEYT